MKFNVYKFKNPANAEHAKWLLGFTEEQANPDEHELIPESEYTYKHRLVIEFQELKVKYIKLSKHLMNNSDEYLGKPATLHVQLSIMKSYLEILKLRIKEEGIH